MKCDGYEVLHQIIRDANRTFTDFPRSCKSILRGIVRALSLEDAAFFQYSLRERRLSRVLSASGPDLFISVPRPSAPAVEGEILRSRNPRLHEGRWLLPVASGRHGFGVLSFSAAPGSTFSDEQLKLFGIVAEQLSTLAQFDRHRREERRHLAQLSLLSDLGQQLNRVRHLRELMRTAVHVVLRQSGAACVILRPLYGGALLGRSIVRIQGNATPLRPLFVGLEEEQSSRLLKETAAIEPVFHRIGGRESSGALPFPPLLVVVPLSFQEQVVGTLTLFGDEDNPFLRAADPEAKRFLSAIGSQIAHGLERVLSRERLEALSVENDRKLRETTLLHRVSRAMHSTLKLNELIHLILSAAVAPGVGGFERAMLFMINERSDTLQGMLCVTQETASLVLPPDLGATAWERPMVTEQAQEAQRQAPCCRMVIRQRLPLGDDNPLSQAARRGRVVFVSRPGSEGPLGAALTSELGMGPYACAPLLGRDRPFGVLVVDNSDSGENIPPSRRRFLELFANQAGGAMENSMLLHRLETAHQDLREAQERLIQGEKMAILGEMAASVAHELRNPLVPIGGFAKRLARSAAEGSRELEYASIIVREAQRMEEMLSNILAFSKKQMLCFTECQITPILQEAIDLEIDALARGAVLVVRELAPELPSICCDENKLRQVLINLITNARQAMPDGGTLTLRATRTFLRGEEAVAIEVEDTGGGIAPDILHNVFNPFFTTKEKGTGLGLSISRRIIEQHRGEIEVRNRERGAAFILRLPVLNTAGPAIDKAELFR